MKRFLSALVAALFWTQSAFAITVTPIGHANFAIASNTLVITTTANIASSDIVIVCVIQGGSTVSTPTAADTSGNTYADVDGSGSFGSTLEDRFRVNNATAMASGNSITISWVTAPTTAAATAITMSGLASPAVKDGRAGFAIGSSTAPSATNSNPTTQPNESTGCVGVQGPTTDTFTEDANYTSAPSDGTNTGIPTNDSTIHLAYFTRFATGSHTYAPTLGTSRPWLDSLVDFKSPGGCGALGLLGAGC